MRKLFASVAAAVLLAGGVVVGVAPSASASTPAFSGTITTSDTDISSDYFVALCNWDDQDSPLQAASHSFRVTDTGSYTFPAASTPSGLVFMAVFADSYSESNCIGSDNNGNLTVSLNAGQDYELWIWLCHQCSTDFTGSYTIGLTGPGELASDSPQGTDSTPASTPTPQWIQAYGRFGADAECADGWDAAWQEWAQPITGGWVCTRTVPSLGQ